MTDKELLGETLMNWGDVKAQLEEFWLKSPQDREFSQDFKLLLKEINVLLDNIREIDWGVK
jgi:hypothetical protein